MFGSSTTESGTPAEAASPVESIATDRQDRGLTDGIALCLSGGGYRAMLFHAGSLWRLNELGYLRRIYRFSSVSGGSITSGVLASNWSKLDFDGRGVGRNFIPAVIEPLRRLADKTLDVKSILTGVLGPGSVGERLADHYDDCLYGKKTLQDLPDEPRFVFNATNVQSGALWRFMKPYMRDYRVGEVKNPRVRLAIAIAASSAFPPVLSPVELKISEAAYTPNSGLDLQRSPYTTNVVLTDGGVYDNLGLETAWKRYTTILVSDAGGKLSPQEEPDEDWVRHARRVVDLVDNQVRSLRKRQVIDSFRLGNRQGTYWGIRSNIAKYRLADAFDCPHENTLALADTPTRLKRLDKPWQERLINWGYAVCDAAIRKHHNQSLPAPSGWPYPDVKV
jgi:NTE family protein